MCMGGPVLAALQLDVLPCAGVSTIVGFGAHPCAGHPHNSRFHSQGKSMAGFRLCAGHLLSYFSCSGSI